MRVTRLHAYSDPCVHLSRSCRSYTARTYQEAYKTIRCLQLYITMLNEVNRYLIFTAKLYCIGGSIRSGYAAIAHFREYPIFGFMCYAIFLDCALIYCLIYGTAFKVRALFETAKVSMGLCARTEHRGGKMKRKMLLARMRSIPEVGIKVGDFHMMERTSTPIFLHYLLNSVVSMLVAYK